MSSAFCSMEEAFVGPLVAGGGAPIFPGQKPPKQKRRKDGIVVENFVPQALSGMPPAPDRQVTPTPAPEVLRGPSAEEQHPMGAVQQLESGNPLQDFFPLPGDTASTDEWAKAFTLEPSTNPGIPVPRFDGSISVAGKPTLWRQIPAPTVAPGELAPAGQGSAMASAPSEITQRLDTLTRQLEALTAPTPMQSTAELFLFVAIGLLLLLAIDTLLRFASSVTQRSVGVFRGGARRAARGFK